MKVKFINTLLVAALMVPVSGAFVSCKDYESDDVQEMRNLNAEQEKKISDLNNQITALQEKVNGLHNCDPSTCCSALQDLVNTLSGRVTTLENKDYTTGWQTAIENLRKEIANDYATKGDYATKAELTDQVNGLQNALNKLRLDLFAGLTSDSIALQDSINSKYNDLANKYNNLDGKYSQLNLDLTGLKQNVEVSEKALNTRIDSVNSVVKTVQDGIVDVIAAAVTNVIVQGAESPAVGELALPLDIQSRMLVTYYGENKNGTFAFPTRTKTYFNNSDEADELESSDITPTKRVRIAGGQLIDKDGAEGNAGYLYVTVNPSTVDATGVQFALQNSRGEESPVVIGKAAKSDKLLTYGYSRAADNNFYEIPATINSSNLDKLTIGVNTTEVSQAVKKLLEDRNQTKTALKELARKTAKLLYDNMDSNIPRLALATTYNLTSGENTKTLKNVSEMNLLAAAFKPVGFGALDNANISSAPGLERAENLIVRYFNGLNADIHTIGLIQMNSDGRYTVVSNGNTLDVTDLIKSLNADLEDVNNMITELKGDLSASSVTGYLDRANDLFVKWFNRGIGAALKPVLLINPQGGKDAHRVTAAGLTVKAGNYTLVPTTWTYELIAPAYKKYVKVYSGSESPVFDSVIDGDVREVPVTLQSGKTYTVVYEAVDYTGMVEARKYTITVE